MKIRVLTRGIPNPDALVTELNGLDGVDVIRVTDSMIVVELDPEEATTEEVEVVAEEYRGVLA